MNMAINLLSAKRFMKKYNNEPFPAAVMRVKQWVCTKETFLLDFQKS